MDETVHPQPVPWISVIIDKAGDAARSLRSAVGATVGQVGRRRLIVIAVLAVIFVSVAVLVPLPSPVELRDWATSVGPWFPLAFLLAHIVVTIFPVPRTAFTLSAGLLFGPGIGVGLAVLASTISALVALLLVRAVGWQFHRMVKHPSIDNLDARLNRRGWPSILSLRLIPAVPFSVVNYAAGASSVRIFPFVAATLIGLVPGTTALVVLGDALTGDVSPLMFAVSACIASVGVAVLILDVRAHRREREVEGFGSLSESRQNAAVATTKGRL